jgi:glycosyltransferase involved in cell wall biosynthesis
MSVYNAEEFLRDSIDSILNQTYSRFEFIIIDDCSIDSTSSILDSYRVSDSRIIVKRNSENRGLAYSLNAAIQDAEGEYIARMDADDISLPTRFEKQTRFLNKNQSIEVCGTACIEVNSAGNELFRKSMPLNNSEIDAIIFKMNPFIHPTVMLRHSFFKKVGLYDETFIKSQDLELWARAYVAGIQMANLPDFLLLYRMEENFWSKRTSAVVIRNEIRVIKYLINHSGKYQKYVTVLVPKALFRLIQKIIPSKLNQKLYNYLRS